MELLRRTERLEDLIEEVAGMIRVQGGTRGKHRDELLPREWSLRVGDACIQSE